MQILARSTDASPPSASLQGSASTAVADGERPWRVGAKPRGVIVMGGDSGALGVARSLGRAGVPVFIISGRNPIAAWSRYIVGHSAQPQTVDATHTIAWLDELAMQRGLRGWLLMPAGDAEVRLVAQHHDALSAVFTLCTPSWRTTRWAADKSLTYRRAAALDIPYPRTYALTDANDIATLDCTFPLILKPAAKEGTNALTSSKAWRLDDRAALSELYARARALAGDGGLIVQEMIPGGGDTQFSYAAICQDGKPVISMVARRTRQHPSEFGTGTYVETLECPEIEALGERFLSSIGFSGMVEIEFKFDARDRAYKLIDVNPRIWTWNSLGAKAGVDFALTMWRMAQGDTPPRARARSGASWMYLSRDIIEAVKDIVTGRLSLARYLRSFTQPVTFATFVVADPVPALLDIPLSLKRALRDYLPFIR